MLGSGQRKLFPFDKLLLYDYEEFSILDYQYTWISGYYSCRYDYNKLLR